MTPSDIKRTAQVVVAAFGTASEWEVVKRAAKAQRRHKPLAALFWSRTLRALRKLPRR